MFTCKQECRVSFIVVHTVMYCCFCSFLHAESGFCDHDVTITESHGSYTWNETEANITVIQSCVFGMGTTNAKRFCSPNLMDWEDPDVEECPTFVTEEIQNLGNVSNESERCSGVLTLLL